MQLLRSKKVYPSYENKKQAVIDKYNQMYDEKEGEQVDWGETFAELIAAYVESR